MKKLILSLSGLCLCLGLMATHAETSLPETASLAYPDLYVEMGLPQLPGAEVIDVGRDNSTLENGMTVKLRSNFDSASLRSFFESTLTDESWVRNETIATSKMRELGVLDQLPFAAVFKKGELTYQVFSHQQGDKAIVSISVVRSN
ncbi:MAG: hypothetical protein ACI9GW_003110 [Halieaceae bacterium]